MIELRRLRALASSLLLLLLVACEGGDPGVERWRMDIDETLTLVRRERLELTGVDPAVLDAQLSRLRIELLQIPEYRLRLAPDKSFVLSTTGPGFGGRTLSVPGTWVQRPRGIELKAASGEPEELELVNGTKYTQERRSGLGTYDGELLVLAWEGGDARIVMRREQE